MKRIIRLGFLPLMLMSGFGQQGLPQQPGQQEQVGYLVFRVGLDKIYPETINLEEGWWQIRLMNGITTDGITVALDDEAGLALSRGVAPARAGRSKILVYLRPGRTVLSIPGHPKWRAELQVKPKKA